MKSSVLISTLFVLLGALTGKAAEYATFEVFYQPAVSIGAGGWVLIGLAVVVAGVVVYFTAGTAGPVVTAIAAQIGASVGLSGAAAVSYGLALMGGGAVAAGGLGMIGGAAVITMALTFGTEVAVGYGLAKADSHYEAKRFIEQSRSMLTLPPPRVTTGSRAYENAVKRLSALDSKVPLTEDANQAVLMAALKIVEDGRQENLIGKGKQSDLCQLQTLQALLHFQRNEYAEARHSAQAAITTARGLERRRTLPAFIYAVSAMYDPQPDVATILPDYLRHSMLAEPDNPLIPTMCAIFLDRAMYRYNSGGWTCEHLAQLTDIVCEKAIEREAPASLAIVSARTLIQIKREQQSVYANTKTVSRALLEDPDAVAFLEARLKSFTELLDFMSQRMTGELEIRSEKLPKDSGVEVAKVRSLLEDYRNDIPNMRAAIDAFAQRQQAAHSRNSAVTFAGIIAASVTCSCALVWFLRKRRMNPAA